MTENTERFPLKVVALSRNAKIGLAAATYRPVGETCPSDCFFLNNGCYAQRHVTGIHARKSADDYHELDRALSSGVKLIRHHVSGDFFKDDKFDREYFDYVVDWHRRNKRMHGYAYTHRIEEIIDAGITSDDLPNNFVLVASLDDDADNRKDKVHAAGFTYARISGTMEESLENRQANEVVCPNQLAKKLDKPDITCSQCKICTHGKADVVFIKH